MEPRAEFSADHLFTRVKGGSILPSGAFLKALPLVVDLKQRLVLDGLTVASDFAASAYSQMIVRALETIEQDNGADTVIVRLAWSMVDQLYSIRQLLGRLATPGPLAQEFLTATQDVPNLRNRMDHLASNISNIANKKGPERSLFGSVTYFVSGVLIGQTASEVFLVSHHVEPIRPGECLGSAVIPETLNLPVGNFQLHCAGHELDIDLAMRRLCDLMVGINKKIETEAKEQIDRLVTEHDVSEEELFTHFGAAVKFILSFSMHTVGESGQEK